jgi:hypothetical protein
MLTSQNSHGPFGHARLVVETPESAMPHTEFAFWGALQNKSWPDQPLDIIRVWHKRKGLGISRLECDRTA